MLINDITEIIKKYNNFLILTHSNPDGDAYGSSVALALSLETLGKNAVCVFDSEIVDKYSFLMSGLNYFLLNSYNTFCYDCIIVVDCASYERIGRCSGIVDSNAPILNIDHHITNNSFGFRNYVVDSAASAVPVFRIIKALNVTIDKKISNALFCALVTDTGHFSYSCTNKEVFSIVSELLDYGLDIPYVSNSIYFSRSLNATKLIGLFINNISLWYDEKVALSHISLKEISDCGADVSDCECGIDYVAKLKNVKIAVFFREIRSDYYKVSFRSKDDINVAEIASVFGGGGHKKASGCALKGCYFDVRDTVLNLLGDYIQ